jgi:hypothetical protein
MIFSFPLPISVAVTLQLTSRRLTTPFFTRTEHLIINQIPFFPLSSFQVPTYPSTLPGSSYLHSFTPSPIPQMADSSPSEFDTRRSELVGVIGDV